MSVWFTPVDARTSIAGGTEKSPVALSLRDRTAGRANNVDWLLQVDRANDVGEAFGLPVAERQGYFRAEKQRLRR